MRYPGRAILGVFLLLAASAVAVGEVSDGARPHPSPLPKGEGAAAPARSVPTTRGPAPPTEFTASDHPWDDGRKIDLTWVLSPDDEPDEEPAPAGPNGETPEPARKKVQFYKVYRSGEPDGPYKEAGISTASKKDYPERVTSFTVEKCDRGEPYWFRVTAVGPDGMESALVQAGPAVGVRQFFDGGRLWLGILLAAFCGAVVYWIAHARSGRPVKVRKIAGLEAVDEAVGRATEMGRCCLFVPGIQDMNDIQTIAGLTVLGRVAQTAAQYGATVDVPTCRSLVMTAARETVQTSFLTAGRPDAYREDDIYYVTDEQFGYVAYLTGAMVRKRPAACFYMGSFYAEALIIAETGNSIGAIQVAGTAEPAQLPFFVAACDYTLIGEEFFAASAYLSGDPEQLGSLKGQDVGKAIVGVLLVVGCLIATCAVLTGFPVLAETLDYLRDEVLR
jgi:hypothetical protein